MLEEKEAAKAFDNMRDAITFMVGAVEIHYKAKEDYNTKKLMALADGSITGKNTDEREASAIKLLDKEYKKMVNAAEVERAAKEKLDLARLEIERLYMLLRIEELATIKVK